MIELTMTVEEYQAWRAALPRGPLGAIIPADVVVRIVDAPRAVDPTIAQRAAVAAARERS